MPEFKTAFAGTPQFARTILAQLTDGEFRPELAITQPDRRSGRGRKVEHSPVKSLALDCEIDLWQPRSLRTSKATQRMNEMAPDVLIVAAYGLILPKTILAIPTYGCINVHASLLPRWRGAAPIERALMAGDPTTGVSIMQMEAGLDTGPVFCTQEIQIDLYKGAQFLEEQIAKSGAQLLVQVLADIRAHHEGHASLPRVTAQDDSKATYAEKLTDADRYPDWTCSATEVLRKIYALADRMPVTVSFGELRVQLLSAKLGNDAQQASAPPPGTVVSANKHGITVQCGSDELQITRMKLNRGKGTVLDPAAARNMLKSYGVILEPGMAFGDHRV